MGRGGTLTLNHINITTESLRFFFPSSFFQFSFFSCEKIFAAAIHWDPNARYAKAPCKTSFGQRLSRKWERIAMLSKFVTCRFSWVWLELGYRTGHIWSILLCWGLPNRISTKTSAHIHFVVDRIFSNMLFTTQTITTKSLIFRRQ